MKGIIWPNRYGVRPVRVQYDDRNTGRVGTFETPFELSAHEVIVGTFDGNRETQLLRSVAAQGEPHANNRIEALVGFIKRTPLIGQAVIDGASLQIVLNSDLMPHMGVHTIYSGELPAMQRARLQIIPGLSNVFERAYREEVAFYGPDGDLIWPPQGQEK